MKKCALCGERITDKKKCVKVGVGKWWRRKWKHFHLDCFIADKRRGYDVVRRMTNRKID